MFDCSILEPGITFLAYYSCPSLFAGRFSFSPPVDGAEFLDL